jgi:hypothetical protein
MVVRLQAEVTRASATMGCYAGCAKGNLWGKEMGSDFQLDFLAFVSFSPHRHFEFNSTTSCSRSPLRRAGRAAWLRMDAAAPRPQSGTLGSCNATKGRKHGRRL